MCLTIWKHRVPRLYLLRYREMWIKNQEKEEIKREESQETPREETQREESTSEERREEEREEEEKESTETLEDILRKVQQKARCLCGGAETLWDHVRYLIEKHFDLIEQRPEQPRGKHIQGAYVVAWRWHDFALKGAEASIIKSHDFVEQNEVIVLARRPVPRHRYNDYVPLKFQESMPQFLDDAQKIEALLRPRQRTRHSFRQSEHHMSEKGDSSAKRKRLDPHYICHSCGNPGHLREDCPHVDDPQAKPFKKRCLPKGLPRDQLRVAKPEEEHSAPFFCDGVFLIPKQNNEEVSVW